MEYKNTSQVWDNIWRDVPSESEDKYHLVTEEKSIRWKRIKKIILEKFGSFKGLKVIEIGAGQGTYSLLFALEGAEVTLLDYSPDAIKIGKLFFKRNHQKANFVMMNALNIDLNKLPKFDVSISVGVGEHFERLDRFKIVKAHFDVLRKGGLAFVDVPNKWCLPYRLHKYLSQKFGKWQFGYEEPYSRFELNKIAKKLGKRFFFIGGYILDTPFNFWDRIRRMLGIKKKDIKDIRFQIGTPLDKYISRTLIAVGVN